MNNAKQEEFLELYSSQEKRLSAFALALARNRDDAKDLVGETVLRAYETFDKVRSKQAFPSYLFSIASRLHKRKIWRKRLFGEWDDEYANNLPSQEISPEIRFDIYALYFALDKLSIKMKESIILFEISGFSIKEICEIQNSSESAVKSRLKRAREKLADLLGQEQYQRNTPMIHSISHHNASNNNIENIQLKVGNEKI